jgi:hypothetical protein
MDKLTIAFYLFGFLTLAFAAALLVWIFRPRTNLKAELVKQDQIVTAIRQGGGDRNAQQLAEAVSTILKAITDFGTKLDTMGPVAVLGVFTVVFALLTIGSAWLGHS